MKDLHLDIPHIQGERINEFCEPTKCKIIREISDPQPNIPHNKSEMISELSESTKCEVEIFQQENSEMSDPPPFEILPNEKREEHSMTNLSQNSLSLQYVQVQKAYHQLSCNDGRLRSKNKYGGHGVLLHKVHV